VVKGLGCLKPRWCNRTYNMLMSSRRHKPFTWCWGWGNFSLFFLLKKFNIWL